MTAKLSSAKSLTATEADACITHRSSVGTDHSNVAQKVRVLVAGLEITTGAAEVSAAIGGSAANQFIPVKAICHMEAVTATPASGDAAISIGITTPGGVEIIGATNLTNLIGLNDRFVIALTGKTDPIPANSTIYVTVTTGDSTASAGHLVDVYVVGEIVVSGT